MDMDMTMFIDPPLKGFSACSIRMLIRGAKRGWVRLWFATNSGTQMISSGQSG